MSKRLAALLAAGACALAACGGNAGPADAPPAEEARSDAGIQLFQYPWRDVAESCPGLAEAGLSWVLLSPAQEHPVGEEWWWSYQPVSYQIKSRQGTREDFAAMVEACHAVGIEVYADAVVNHMTGIDGGTGFAGTEFTHYEYPGLGGFNRSSQHPPDCGGVQRWRRRTGGRRPAMCQRVRVGSGVQIGHCGRRCAHPDDLILRGRCSASSGV